MQNPKPSTPDQSCQVMEPEKSKSDGDKSNIAKRWRELSGLTKWEGLLDPPDDDLRRYLINYGQLAQATYDSFNNDRASRYAGDCRFQEKELFSRVGLQVANPFKYRVVKHIYATSDVKLPRAFIFRSSHKDTLLCNSNWIGFVAVVTDEGKAYMGRRDIVVAWRGTVLVGEWLKDFDSPMVSSDKLFGDAGEAAIHRGWLSLYTSENGECRYAKDSARQQVLSQVKRIIEMYKDEEISITVSGHSLGAALGTLNATDIVANKVNRPPKDSKNEKPYPVTAFLFASPKVGGLAFRKLVDDLEHIHILQIANVPDLIPRMPLGTYVNVGMVLEVNSMESEYLERPGKVRNWHNLEVYLHMVAGSQGSIGGFKLGSVKRDIALVNKHTGALEDENMVPVKWWCIEHKGMVQQSDGTWKLEDHHAEDEA